MNYFDLLLFMSGICLGTAGVLMVAYFSTHGQTDEIERLVERLLEMEAKNNKRL